MSTNRWSAVALFGDSVVYLASITDPATLELSAALMDHVRDGADALLTMRGHLAEQHCYIGGLAFDVRLVLCMWLMDKRLQNRQQLNVRTFDSRPTR
jgi:hypothetical protein